MEIPIAFYLGLLALVVGLAGLLRYAWQIHPLWAVAGLLILPLLVLSLLDLRHTRWWSLLALCGLAAVGLAVYGDLQRRLPLPQMARAVHLQDAPGVRQLVARYEADKAGPRVEILPARYMAPRRP